MFALAWFALTATGTLAGSVPSQVNRKIAAYIDPRTQGGSMLTAWHEPLNVIISGLSSPFVLGNDGIFAYGNAIDFSNDCFNIHLGDKQSADLGDGHGFVNQTLLLRENFGIPSFGTCFESLLGGNHYRVFRQDGPTANSNALFLAVSEEKTAAEHHDIIPNGYNLGRDHLVAAAIGKKNYGGIEFNTVAENITGLLPIGAGGINHDIALDGIVTLLTITTTNPIASLNCHGSALCSSLPVSHCDAAVAKIDGEKLYRTGSPADSGVCSGHCGIFVQGTNCKFSGLSLIDSYGELRRNNCKICGSKMFETGCLVTINYVSKC